MLRFQGLLIFLVVPVFSFAQLVDPLTFREKVHDFGNIKESDGATSFDFVLTNRSTRPITILKVQPSCGCTTPSWTKEPIAPGETGFIKASYDPKGRPGYFNKSLSVTTDWDGNPITLQIKGNVVTPTAENPSAFSAKKGNLLFKSNSFNVGKVYINREPEVKTFLVYNSSKETISFLSAESPKYITMTLPPAIAPNETASIKIMFDGKLKDQYGFTTENVMIKTTDSEMPDKIFSVYATVEEYFPKLTEAELAKAPVLSLSGNLVNFGVVKQGATLEREITITNSGKGELIIRHAQSNCSCLTILPGSRRLKSGQQTSVKISLNTEGRTGPQNKSITLYSTDPINPVQRVTFTAMVERN